MDASRRVIVRFVSSEGPTIWAETPVTATLSVACAVMFTAPPESCLAGFAARAEMVGGIVSVEAFVVQTPHIAAGQWMAHQYVNVPDRKASNENWIVPVVPLNWSDSGSPGSMRPLP